MANPNLDRSKRHEREIVHSAEDAGLDADRAWGSDGRSMGKSKECDVRVTDGRGFDWTIQAKRRKSIAQYLTCEETDIVVVREDRAENLAVIPLSDLLKLLADA